MSINYLYIMFLTFSPVFVVGKVASLTWFEDPRNFLLIKKRKKHTIFLIDSSLSCWLYVFFPCFFNEQIPIFQGFWMAILTLLSLSTMNSVNFGLGIWSAYIILVLGISFFFILYWILIFFLNLPVFHSLHDTIPWVTFVNT